jgi:hypothetical protein
MGESRAHRTARLVESVRAELIEDCLEVIEREIPNRDLALRVMKAILALAHAHRVVNR